METKGIFNRGQPIGTLFPRIIKLQIVISVVATIVTIFLSIRIPTLIETKVTLEGQILNLKQEKSNLERQKIELEERSKGLVSAYGQLASQFGAVSGEATAAKNAVVATVASNPDIAVYLPRIFVHIRARLQLDEAKKIGGKLQEHGYIVPGTQIIADKGPTNTQVRYFYSSDTDEAKKIAELLRSLGVKDAVAEPIAGYENSPGVRPRQYEIWFGPRSL